MAGRAGRVGGHPTAARRDRAWRPRRELPVLAVDYSPDGTRIATASTDNSIRIWDVTEVSEIRTARMGRILRRRAFPFLSASVTLRGHQGPVRTVIFAPGRDRVVTASDDGTIRTWSTATLQAVATLIPLPEGGYATLLPDGSYKLDGDPGDRLWWAMKLVRFAPGELDPYVPEIRRLPADAPILPPP